MDRNEFRNKRTLGNMIDVRGSGSQIAQRVWIHHNYFHDFTSPGEERRETIRFGLSGLSLSNGFGLIEHNLFERCTGENELMSNKSSSNTYRYNTISRLGRRRSPSATAMTASSMATTSATAPTGSGSSAIVIRYSGNYLETCVGINIGNGDGEVADGDPLTSHDRPDDCLITFNTLVDNTRNYFMTGRTNGLGHQHSFANNVLRGGGEAASLNGLYTGGVWSGNIIWETAGAGAMPEGAYDVVNPLLESKAKGVFRLQPGSPASTAPPATTRRSCSTWTASHATGPGTKAPTSIRPIPPARSS